MTHDAQHSAADSATTSAAETEAAYLARQSEEARAAIRRALDDLRTNVRGGWHQATDLRAWIDRHPWVAVGAASAAGFAAAMALLPSSGESAREKWLRMFDGHPQAAAAGEPTGNGHAHAEPPPNQTRSALWGMLLNPLIDVLKVALENYLIAAMAGQAAAQAASDACDSPQPETPGDPATFADQPPASTG